jgi:hypothetical protein
MHPEKRQVGHGKLEIKTLIHANCIDFEKRRMDKTRWVEEFKLSVNAQELLRDYLWGN